MTTNRATLVSLFLGPWLACQPPPGTATDANRPPDAAGSDASLPPCPAFDSSVRQGHLGQDQDSAASPLRRLVIMGGSAEVDSASRDFVQAADGGDVLVLRASGSVDSYTPYFFDELAADPAPASVTTLRFGSLFAQQANAVACRVDQAEALWLTGGDQWDYLGQWPDTVTSAIARLSSRGAAVGGTSAGAMVLGQYAFDARHGSVSSTEALADPDSAVISVQASSMSAPELAGCIVDTHFSQRDREGRLLVFAAHTLSLQVPFAVTAIGLDERSALTIENGRFHVAAASGRVVWIYQVEGPADVRSAALELSGVIRVRLADGDSGVWPLDLAAWSQDHLRVAAGVVVIE